MAIKGTFTKNYLEEKMRVLHVSMKHDYGDESRASSYEYVHFYGSLLDLGYEVCFFDYMKEIKENDRNTMNSKLLKTAIEFQPDVALVSLYQNEFEPETFDQLRKICKTLCFFHDDTWRVDFTLKWATHFDYFTSPDFECTNKYPRLGLSNVFHFPFGVNESVFIKKDLKKLYDISFVGQWHPHREWLIKRLEKAGYKVKAAGYGWPDGSVSQKEMVDIFNQSWINLNLSNSTSWDARFLIQSPRGLINTLRSPKTAEQLKGRHFEIPACGGFQLSYYVDGLERYYKIGDEISVFLNADDLIRKVGYYIKQKDRIETMAKESYERTLRDHTYKIRFKYIFNKILTEN